MSDLLKPPLGIEPLNLFLENRIKELNDTIRRYSNEITKLENEKVILETALIRYKNMTAQLPESYREG